MTPREKLSRWRNRPLTRRDRVWAVVLGAIAGFWLALFGRLGLGPMPVSLAVLGYWLLAGILAGALVGYRFPRTARIVFYPFAFLGIFPGGS